MYFSDNDQFPAASWFTWAISWYTTKTLSDPKHGVAVCRGGSPVTADKKCYWAYDVWQDDFSLPMASMKLWVIFEKEENTNKIAKDSWSKWDGWNIGYVYEVFAWAWAWSWRTVDPSVAWFTWAIY